MNCNNYIKSGYNNPTEIKRIFVVVSSVALTVLTLASCSKNPDEKYTELMKKSTSFMEQKKWDEARITLLSAAKLKPTTADTFYHLAEVYSRLNQLGQAVSSYKTAINIDPLHKEARSHLAAIFIAAGAAEQAEEHVEQILKLNPEDLDALVLRSSILRIRGEKNKAREILDSVVQKDPNNKMAIANLGSIALDEGKFEEAENLLNRAWSIDPNNGPIKLALVDAYIRKGDIVKADKTLKELVEKDPQNPSLRYFYAEFLFARGMGEQAEEQYHQVIRIDPTRHVSRDRLYDLYLAKNQRAKARSLTASLQSADPKSLALPYFTGRDLELDSDTVGAYKLFINTIEQMPTFAPAFRRAGLLELVRGDNTQGIEHLNQAVGLDGFDIGAHMALGRILLRQKDFSGATLHAKKILSKYPNQVGASVLLADVALVENRLSEARKIYELLIKAFPSDPEGYVKIGLLAEKEKNQPEALENYKKALMFDSDIVLPARRVSAILAKNSGVDTAIKEITSFRDRSHRNIPEYNMILGLLYLSKGQNGIGQAKVLINQAVEKKPELTEAYLALAKIESISGNLEGSINQWKNFAEKNQKNISAKMLIGVSYEKLGKKQEAENYYRDILKISPRFAPAANNLAWIMSNTGKDSLEEAEKLANVALQEMPGEPAVMDTTAWIYYKRGNLSGALSLLENAVDVDKRRAEDEGTVNAEILYHLALVKEAMGDKDSAMLVAKEAEKILLSMNKKATKDNKDTNNASVESGISDLIKKLSK